MLGQRTITKGLRLPSCASSWVVAFVVGLFALLAVVASSCLLRSFAGGGPSIESASFHPSALEGSSLTQAPIAAESASLDDDLDNDGQVVEGIVDSLGAHPAGIANPLVGTVLVLLLIPSVGGGSSLLALYKLPMSGCAYYLPLERPG